MAAASVIHFLLVFTTILPHSSVKRCRHRSENQPCLCNLGVAITNAEPSTIEPREARMFRQRNRRPARGTRYATATSRREPGQFKGEATLRGPGVDRLSLKSPAALRWPTRGLSIGGQGDHHLRCGDHSVPPSEPFNIVLLKRTSAAVAMASFI